MSTPHQQWEYDLIESIRPLELGELDEMGLDGWQLCGVVEAHNCANKIYYFKRLKQ